MRDLTTTGTSVCSSVRLNAMNATTLYMVAFIYAVAGVHSSKFIHCTLQSVPLCYLVDVDDSVYLTCEAAAERVSHVRIEMICLFWMK